MKFGSVAFFKRLIVSAVVALIVIPLVLAVVFGVLWQSEKRRADGLESRLLLAEPHAATTETLFPDAPEAVGVIPSQPQLPEAGEFHAYQTLYPELYASPPAPNAPEEGVCYLTFDDGPSENTALVLDTLEQYNIKATFFVTGEASVKYEDQLRAAAAAGHTIGVHSYSHDYMDIYVSVENYLADFDKMYHRILDVTGQAPTIFRFPGGSVNTYNQDVYADIIAEMTRRGFVYFDWNAAGSDAVAGGIAPYTVTANVLQSAAGRERAVVLLHDRPDNVATAAALPDIIDGMSKIGFTFEPLTNAVAPVTYFNLE